MRKWRSVSVISAGTATILMALLAACGDDDTTIPGPETEAGSDGPSNQGSDGASGNDATSDATPNDAGTDSASDASDASDGSDASDAGDAADAMVDADADAGPLVPNLFDPAVIPVFNLTIDPTNLAILSNPSTVEADQKKWAKGSFTHDGVTVADVGIRRKGSSTFRYLPNKAAFKIRFDRNVKGQRYAGLTDLTLNNMVSDDTFLAERLGYHAFRTAGFPAQRANTVHLYINGDDYGIYANVETPNKDFLARIKANAGPDGKTLFEANGGGNWMPGVEDNFEMDVGEDEDEADLTALFQKVALAQSATLLADVSGSLHTEDYLRYAAFEGIIGQVDGYGYGVWGSHNYYMLGDQGAKFRLLPWSLDLSFSNNNGIVNLDQPKKTFSGDETLLTRCKAAPTCWADYKTQVAALVAAFQAMNLEPLAKQWHAQIDALARNDPKREASIGAYEGETNKLYAWLLARPGVVKAQMGIP